MATDKPRFSLTFPDDMLARVEQYQEEQKISTKSKAIQKLIEIGLKESAGDSRESKHKALSPLVTKYEALDPHSRKVVDAIIELEADRFAREILTPPLPKMRTIPLFCAAAGPGEPVAQSPFEEYEIPEHKKADFAVKISGDSMEPELHDGDVVLCLKRRPDDGELAVMMVNGFLLVKQYITDGINIYLRSLNRKRKDLDVDIWASGNDTVVGYGTVIHKRLPLVIE